ncbi:hypothetical protein ACFL42_02920 [Candidatus Omnitrophota bacterium]
MIIRRDLLKVLALFAVYFAFIVFADADTVFAQEVADLRDAPHDIMGLYRDSEVEKYYRQAVAAGGKIVNLPEYGTFFVYWLPEGFSKAEEKKVLVVLHGGNANAYQHLINFIDTADKEVFGVISVQWGEPGEEYRKFPLMRLKKWEKIYLYFEPDVVYEIIGAALEYTALKYDVDKYLSAWSGFDRSAGQCAVYAFYDKYTENNFFKLFIALSGGIESGQPMMAELAGGEYGDKPIGGKNFYLWCSGDDADMKERMSSAKDTIEWLGGTVQELKVGSGGHAGFNKGEKSQLEAVKLWDRL